jgi:tRNA nucleotidyltransferase/poly(A) polymerase
MGSRKKSAGVYKPLSAISPTEQEMLDTPTASWLDRDYPYVVYPDDFSTLQELNKLIELAPLRREWGGLVQQADEDFTVLFRQLCSDLGIPYPQEQMDAILADGRVLITKLKFLYNRQRPYQVAEEHGIPFTPMDSETAHTPSYPSGHTIQAYLLASCLAQIAPQHRKVFMDLANRVSWSRAIGGYHWPSDLTFGKALFRHIVNKGMPSSVRVARGKAKKDVGQGGLDEWFSGHGKDKGEATWGDWVSISPVKKTIEKDDGSKKTINPGDIIGPCGISDEPEWKDLTNDGKDPFKCMPRDKAHGMSKKERAELAREKQRAEKKDKGEGKKPTHTPTFKKKKAMKDPRVDFIVKTNAIEGYRVDPQEVRDALEAIEAGYPLSYATQNKSILSQLRMLEKLPSISPNSKGIQQLHRLQGSDVLDSGAPGMWRTGGARSSGGTEYVAGEQIPAAMKWWDTARFPPFQKVAVLMQIHPFEDGNGRVGRMVLLKLNGMNFQKTLGQIGGGYISKLRGAVKSSGVDWDNPPWTKGTNIMSSMSQRVASQWVSKKVAWSVYGSAHARSIAMMKWLSQATKKLRVDRDTYVVGGAVRNFVIDRPIKDIDVVIDSVRSGHDGQWLAEKLADMIQKETGKKPGLITDQYLVTHIGPIKSDWIVDGENVKGEKIEIATARAEEYAPGEGKGHKPKNVWPVTVEEDIVRREFTFNTMLWRLSDLASGPEKAEIIDLTGCGMKDLKEGILACPADPDKTFSDDPSRILRAIKFTGKYGFKIPPDLAKAIKRNAPKMLRMPWEGIATILVENILKEPTARKSLKQMKDLGILDVLSEMIKRTKPMQSYLARQLKKNRQVGFLLDLMDLGVPADTPLTGLKLNARQLQRFREITLGMDEKDASKYLDLLISPPIDNRKIFETLDLKGPDRSKMRPTAQMILLEIPSLATNPRKLTDEVIRALR